MLDTIRAQLETALADLARSDDPPLKTRVGGGRRIVLFPFARDAAIPEAHLPMHAGASRFLFARKEAIGVPEAGAPASGRAPGTTRELRER